MYQLYTHPAALDTNLPYKANIAPGSTLFFYSRKNNVSGFTFDSEFTDDSSLVVDGLGAAPAGALLVYRVGGQRPTGLSSGAIAFSDGSRIICRLPLEGNGLGFFQGAVPIPKDAATAYFAFRGIAGDVSGQIRVCDRENIPYQPLKG